MERQIILLLLPLLLLMAQKTYGKLPGICEECAIEVGASSPRAEGQPRGAFTYSCDTQNGGDYEVHILGCYEPVGRVREFQKEPTIVSPVRVDMITDLGSRPRPIKLVLSSYEAVHWIINEVPDRPVEEILIYSIYAKFCKVNMTSGRDISITMIRDYQGFGERESLTTTVIEKYGFITSFTGTYAVSQWELTVGIGSTCQIAPVFEEDQDECTTSINRCDHLCRNTLGSYECLCRSGYVLGEDGKSCHLTQCFHDSTHECHGPNMLCKNDVGGGYHCECVGGFAYAADIHLCVDINECMLEATPCEHQCVNTPGSYVCQPPDASDQKSVSVPTAAYAVGGTIGVLVVISIVALVVVLYMRMKISKGKQREIDQKEKPMTQLSNQSQHKYNKSVATNIPAQKISENVLNYGNAYPYV